MNTPLPRTELERLILEARPLASRIARRVARVHSSLSVDDLYQEAMIGVIRAATTYDPSRGVSFSTYAYPWAFSAARRAQLNRGSMIRTPVGHGIIGRVHVLSTDALIPADSRERVYGDIWLVDETNAESLFRAREFIGKVMDLLSAECNDQQVSAFERTVLGDDTMAEQAVARGVSHSAIAAAREGALHRARRIVKCLWHEHKTARRA